MRQRLRSEKRFRALEAGALRFCSIDLGDQPDPNPGLERSAEASERVGMESVALGREQLELARKLGDEQLALARPIAQEQAAMMSESRERGTDQWNQYLATFQPIEERVAKEAMEYDSPAEMDRRAQQAAADVDLAYGRAWEQGKRDLTRMGVNPNSGRFLTAAAGLPTEKAKDTAHAMNTAREGVRDKAMALRAGAAAFGRNQPNVAGQMTGLATNAGSSAANTLNSTVASTMAAQGTGGQWTGTGLQGINQAGNLHLNAYNAQMQAQSGLYQGLGMAGGALIASKPWTWSDPKKKRGVQDVSDAEVLEEVKRTPVKRFRYKDGIEDGGAAEHMGVMADDAADQMGVGDGERLPVMDMVGKSLAAVRGLAKQVERIDRKMSRFAARGVA